MTTTNTFRLLHIVLSNAAAASGGTSFDFKGLALILAGISLGLIGAIMSGAALFPEVAEQYKRHITTVITGLILVGVSTLIIGAVGG